MSGHEISDLLMRAMRNLSGNRSHIIRETEAMNKHRSTSHYIITISFAILCGLIIYLQRSDIILSTFAVSGIVFSTSDFFMMIAAGMCGYLYGTITFFVVLLTEIYRILSANDAPNIMMIFSLYIYVVIGMLTGFAVKKLWFRSWKRIVILGVLLTAVLSISWYFLAHYLVPIQFETYNRSSLAELTIGALPEVILTLLLLKLFLRFSPDHIKELFGDCYIYTRENLTASDDIVHSLGDKRYSILQAVEMTVLSITSLLLADMQVYSVLESLEIDPGQVDFFIMNLEMFFMILCLMVPVSILINDRMTKITREKLIKEQALEVELKSAEAENKAKSAFLSSMSHEIRTPINAVLGMDEMILRETGEDQTYEYAESIRTAGNTLLSLVNDVLDYSKIEAGKMDIIPVEYELSSTLNDLVNMIRVRAENKGLSLSVNVSPTLPGHLYGDEIRIKQIVTNILTNAVKYTEKGGVTLSVDFTKTADDEIELRISVKDTGIGIRKEDIGKLFSEFERIEEKRNRNIEGTGLGMSITTRLLHMMGSELHVDSVYGEGSDFYFSLKQKVVKWEPMGDYREALRRSISLRKAYRESFTAPDALVLVVDDIPMNLKVFTGLLKKTKLQFDTAGSGLECLEKVTKQRYDIIFLDHQMPEPDGIETLHRMRALPQNINKNTPVIALTANAVSGAREEYIASGFDDYLTKPIDTVALERMLIHYLPDDKVVLSSDADNGASTGEAIGITDEELSRIDGMDIPFARMHLPETELLMTALSDFYQTVDIQADKLDELMNTLPESMDGYRIQVHGMKSSAAIIGLTGLSGMAKILEYAARDKDMQKISSLHPIFMIEWRKTKSDMRGVPGIAGDDDAPKLNYNAGEVRGLLSLLASSMEEFDLDRSDKIIEKLKEYDHPTDVGEQMEKIYAAVADVDADKVKELVEAI